jgi:formylmethanofuran dehydrogenase subunit A
VCRRNQLVATTFTDCLNSEFCILNSMLRIIGGTVYDPANGIDGLVRDICVAGGRIVADVAADAPTIDARGMVVMPGGVDMHSHVASGSVNLARRLLPEEHDADPALAPALVDGQGRSGTGGTVPSTFTTGYRYAGLGYTTVFDAAVAPLMARASHAEFDDTPIVDGGFFVLMGNDEYLLRLIDAEEQAQARDYAAWLLGASGGYAIKVVNPGGVEMWKRGSRERTELDTPIGSTRVTPRAILETLVDASESLALPHATHIHCNNLGLPGNVQTTIESMRAVTGRRAHFTHLQFHAYAAGQTGAWQSGARELIEYVNGHPETSGDVGQVMFGPATTLTADGPVEYLLHKSSGRKWVNVDIELETGCGIVPYTFKEKAAVAALQWVVGLELFLLSADPWRVVLSTDHPNGGSFLSYPDLIRLLMDRAYRDERLARVNQQLLAGSAMADGIAREYTLSEIAIVTRAGPARLLGLRHKGHLGVGADADVTVYGRDADVSRMFATPRFVVKGGTLVVEEGQLRRAPAGKRLHVKPGFDDAVERGLRRYFDQYATVSFDNYAVGGLRDEPYT